MQIFIAYAEPDRATALSIASALGSEGHVILHPAADGVQAGAPPADATIGRADFLVFLIAPETVAAGSRHLTDLFQFLKRWRGAPSRVLPIHIRAVAPDAVPSALQNLRPLTPTGSVTADTANAVAARRAPAVRARRFMAIGAAAAAVAGLAAVALLMRPAPPVATIPLDAKFSIEGEDNFVYWGSAPTYRLAIDSPGAVGDYTCKAVAEPGSANIVEVVHDPRCDKIRLKLVDGPFDGVSEMGFGGPDMIRYEVFGADGKELHRGTIRPLLSNTAIKVQLSGLAVESDLHRSYYFEPDQTQDIAVVNAGNPLPEPYRCELRSRSASFERIDGCRFKLKGASDDFLPFEVTGRDDRIKLIGQFKLSPKP